MNTSFSFNTGSIKNPRAFLVLVMAFIAFVVLKLLGDSTGSLPSLELPPVVTTTVPVIDTVVSSTHLVVWPEAVSTTAMVVRVVDGDTAEVLLDGQTTTAKVRLLGVNTPESVDPRRPAQCFGKEASNALKTLAQGKRVALVEDIQADDRDKYGRLLRIVVLEDGTDVNATLVAQGYAHAYVGFPMQKARRAQLRLLQVEAEAAGLGLWNVATCAGEAYPQ